MAHEEGIVNLRELSTVHAFPENYFIENIAVRESGALILTVHNREELIYLEPQSGKQPHTLYKFDKGVCGIVEVESDVFYISSGSIGTKGSWAIWRVDLNGLDESSSERPSPEKIADVPNAIFLNGSTLLSREKGLMLAADSLLATIFSVNVTTGEVEPWLQSDLLAKTTSDPIIPGTNGIKAHTVASRQYIYISNSDAKTFLRVPVDPDTLTPAGPLETVATDLTVDDFAFSPVDGAAYLTTHTFQSVVRLAADGSRERVAGGPDDAVVAGTTAAAFGRLNKDKGVLYVTTNGGMLFPVGGEIGPGRVLAVKVDA